MAETSITPSRLPMKSGGHLAPIIPETFEDVQRLARIAVQSGLFKGESGDKGIAQATMVIMKGLEIGIQPMMALENISIINGRSMIWGDLLAALVRSHGHRMEETWEGDGDKLTATCRITRSDTKEVIERKYGVVNAKRARLWGKGTYDTNPERMLQMRARGWCARDAVPEVLKGLITREEMEGVEDRGVLVEVPPPPPPVQTQNELATKPTTPEPDEIVWDDEREILR